MCELDIIFNFEKAYFILDEFLLGGEAQETSKKNVLKAIEQADLLQEVHVAPNYRNHYSVPCKEHLDWSYNHFVECWLSKMPRRCEECTLFIWISQADVS